MAKRTQQHLVKKLIDIGYDAPRYRGGHLSFLVGVRASAETVDWTDLVEAMSKIDYNNFNGHVVATLLAFMVDGGQLVMVEFGREYSPVLYLHPSGSFIDDIHLGSSRSKAIVAYFDRMFRDAGVAPDECQWENDHQRLRLWWD